MNSLRRYRSCETIMFWASRTTVPHRNFTNKLVSAYCPAHPYWLSLRNKIGTIQRRLTCPCAKMTCTNPQPIPYLVLAQTTSNSIESLEMAGLSICHKLEKGACTIKVMNPELDDQEIVDTELPLYMIFVCEQGNLSLITNMNRIIYRKKETIKKD